jgi:hypothetical protein
VAALAPFDVVLCSDCVFWEKLHRPLAQTLALLLLPLAGPEGKVHRFDPKFASRLSSLTENPYKSLRVDPYSGSTL